jgi:nitronate monooxygenase
MFLISHPELVLAQCRAGVIGSFPSLNARPSGVLEQWLMRLRSELTEEDAPFAVNLIVHRTNARLEEDLELCVRYQVRW